MQLRLQADLIHRDIYERIYAREITKGGNELDNLIWHLRMGISVAIWDNTDKLSTNHKRIE